MTSAGLGKGIYIFERKHPNQGPADGRRTECKVPILHAPQSQPLPLKVGCERKGLSLATFTGPGNGL